MTVYMQAHGETRNNKDNQDYEIKRIAHRDHHSSDAKASFHSVLVSHTPPVVGQVRIHDHHVESKDQIDWGDTVGTVVRDVAPGAEQTRSAVDVDLGHQRGGRQNEGTGKAQVLG